MKYSIENKGTGVVLIRVFVPERLASSFLDFINQKDKEVVKSDAFLTKTASRLNNDDYFIKKTELVLDLFNNCQLAGIDKKTSISEVNKKMKVLGFGNISYDQVRNILSENDCLRSKKREIA